MLRAELRIQRWWLEVILALAAALVFLGYLGSIDLWGKREQRAAAEALDTIENKHWLVARIQDRPRLEKPPLPRWTIAALMALTGRRDEWMVRLPSALSALGTVGLVYVLGRRLGGRSVGLSSAFALASLPFFVMEMRQSGNDGPLVFFTSLALYAAWMRLNGGIAGRDEYVRPGSRSWALLMYGALGLGCLTKGPIVVLLAAVTILPYLAFERRLRQGLGLLAHLPGLVLFLGLALSWPVPVLVRDANAVNVWLLEMGQKAGTAGIPHKHAHPILLTAWPWMTLPWVVIASIAAVRPFRRSDPRERGGVWFAWWWSVGNLAMFSFWPVAKPNYFLPCLPGLSLLVGMEWVNLIAATREQARSVFSARRVLQGHWIALLGLALSAPIVAWRLASGYVFWGLFFAAIVLLAIAASILAWRRGCEAGAIAPLSLTIAAGVLIAFGAIAPDYNPQYSHRSLARELEQVVPPHSPPILFFDEVDEGLWFYLHDRVLAAVPESQPRYNLAYARSEDQRNNRLELDPSKRLQNKTERLRAWLARGEHASPYLLMRRSLYEQMSARLGDLVAPIHYEDGLSRYAMILLRITPADTVIAKRDPGAAVAK